MKALRFLRTVLAEIFGLVAFLALVAFCVLMYMAPASAATGNAQISYQRPTTYVDGTALPSSAITGYQVVCTFTPTGSSSSSACTLDTSTLAGGTSSSGSVKLTYPVTGGTACFVLKTLTAAASSDGSQPPACKDFPAVKPSDPTSVTITVTLALNIESDTPIRVTAAEPKVTRSE